MKHLYIKINFIFTTALLISVAACNKEVEQFPDIENKVDTSNQPAIAAAIAADANFSLYNEVIKKSGYADTLNNKNFSLTMFAPNNQAVKTAVYLLTQGQIPANAPDATVAGFIQSPAFPAATANGVVKYNTLYQDVDISSLATTGINSSFPNMVNPAPTVSPFARLSLFLAKGAPYSFVNNVPIVGARVATGNGSIYPVGAVVLPPTRLLWDRITTDPDLTYLKAAIDRADSGLVALDLANPLKSLRGLLNSFGPNITLFAPTDSVFKATLALLITQQLIAAGVPAAMAQAQAAALSSTTGVFTNPATASVLTPLNMKGLIYYHIMGATAFTNNFPTTETAFPTLISLDPTQTDPGLKIKSAFTGPSVNAMTVRGAVLLLPVPANVKINPLPDPSGSSDQLYANGTLHKIDQILLPKLF